jgi:hypothetical protein
MCATAEGQESAMSRKKGTSGMKDLQDDLEELTGHYHEEPEGLSHQTLLGPWAAFLSWSATFTTG